jgi:putative protease
VLKPTEQNIEKFLLSLGRGLPVGAYGLLVRSGGLLEGLSDVAERPGLTGDFSLNVANVLTARELLALGLTRVTPTHDLNAAQITDLAGLVGPERLEVVAYQHLPVFHTEHCVFCRFLSEGTDHTNCGHPCESHRVALRDEKGLAHPVMADVGCRNTVFGAQAQTAARHLHGWLEAGLRDYRLEFVHESAEDVLRVTAAFRAALAEGALAHDREGRGLERELALVSAQGVTEGSLFVPRDFLDLPQLELV